jgi:signal transduction histidine kinase/CheY-like chemotaxis protein
MSLPMNFRRQDVLHSPDNVSLGGYRVVRLVSCPTGVFGRQTHNMRSIQTKFLVAVSSFVILFCGFVFYRSYCSTRQRVEELTASRAELAVQFDLAIRSYVGDTIRPLMEKHTEKGCFIPESMSTSFVARSVFERVKKELPDVIIKFSSDSPRNPVNSAGPDEMRLLRYFREHPKATQWTGPLPMNGMSYFVRCIPRRMEASCLHCHGRPEDAPASLVSRYGAKAGFHREVGDVIALDIVGIPMGEVNASIASESRTQSAILLVGVVALMGALVACFRYFIGRRLAAITAHFQRETAKSDDAHIAPIEVTGHDEIGILAASFNSLASRLHSLHDSLERRVEDRTAMLQTEIASRKKMEELLREAKDKAETANRVKSEFLANMSHELRTPMTAILGFADILLRTPTREEAADAAEIIKRNGEHLLTVINNMLDLSKIEAGRHELEITRCSPRQIVAEVIRTMQVRAAAKGLSLTAEYRIGVPGEVATDTVRLRQILVNLVGNAVKFTDEGSIRVVVQPEPRSQGKERLRFDVIDTGVGIAQEHIAMLFQPFSQVDASAQRRFGGTGLGLAISKRLAMMMGGDITVSSVLGKGATFHLTIATRPLGEVRPSRHATVVARQAATAEVNSAGLNCRVLLAEDGPDNQRLISFLLRKAGAEVTVVEDGQKAVERAIPDGQVSGEFDLILLDMQMPVMDGYEAARRLRALGYRGPILALTAHAMKEDRQKCLDAGCDDYLAKPIDRGALLQIVSMHVAAARGKTSRLPDGLIAGQSV